MRLYMATTLYWAKVKLAFKHEIEEKLQNDYLKQVIKLVKIQVHNHQVSSLYTQ